MNPDYTTMTAWELIALSPPGWGGNLLRGLVVSLQLAAGGYALGLLLGVLGAAGKVYGGRMTRDLMEVYTTLVRAVPELVLILLLYYAGMDALNALLNLAGLPDVEISAMVAGTFVIGVVLGAYATEVLRGAILAIPFGEIEAGRAFGMAPLTLVRRVTLPAMLPHAIPGLANLWLISTKNTALLAVIGFAELTQETRQAAGTTRQYFLFFAVAGLMYLAVTLVSNVVIALIERRARRGLPRAA